MTDFTGDFLTRLRNAQRAGKERLLLPASKLTVAVTEILRKEGFIENYKVLEEGKKRMVRIHLKYRSGKRPAVHSIVRISKPGLRRYVPTEKIPRVRGGIGISILSTSQGVLTGQEAKRKNVGGELVCLVW